MFVLQAGIALMALVSLHPYLLWSHQKPAYAVATLAIVLAGAGCLRALVITRERLLLALAFSLFLVYLSLLPKVGGGTTRWFFLIPFTVALLHLREEDLQGAFGKFYWLFALSVVPGMLIWLLAAVGVPLELRYTDVPREIAQRGDTGYLELPGAVFVLTNSLVLPHGGVLFRLCGMYDEPGTVGTIAALCLAATRYRLTDVRGSLCFAAGLMTFSVAFAILTTLGLFLTALSAKRPWLAAAALATIAVGALPLSGLRFTESPAANISIRMSGAFAPSAPPSGVVQKLAPAPEWGLRNSPGIDSREQPRMRQLLDDYRAAPPGTLLFGVASDASVVHGWGSAVWYRILTDFGIVGFVWLFGLFAWPPLRLWREKRLEIPLVIFCALFLMSFYQRPIIWLPAQLLIYFAGLNMQLPARQRTS